MSWSVLPLAAVLALAALLALKLRGGGGRGDLLAPPRRRPRRLSRAEIEGLMDLVRSGGEEEALRRLKGAGHEEAGARKLIGLMARLAGDGKDQSA